MQFIHKIKDFFKMYFFKEKEESKEIIIEEPLKVELEEPKEDMLFSIQPYDIIRAKRYKNETQKLLIREGHQEGPYIVLDKCDEGLVCSKGTSVDQSNRLNYYFKIRNIKYKLFKETYFKCCDFEIIDDYSFIEKIDELKKEDIESLLRLLKRNRKNYYYNKKGECKKINIPFQVGDIINNIKNYLIIDIKDKKLFCIEIKTTKSYLKNNFEYSDYNYLDYSNIVIFDTNDELEYINTIDNNLLNNILKKQKEYIENKKNQTIAQRGSVIRKENQYYYIYGEEGKDWLVMEIFNIEDLSREKIIINNKIFFTDYVSLKINKKDSFEICFTANNQEIDNIKMQRKSYNKRIKKDIIKDFKIGNIIESRFIKDKRAIIIGICFNSYRCLTIKKLEKAVYQTIYIKKEDAILSENSSLKGIIWLDCNQQFDLSKLNENYLDKIIEAQKKYILQKKELEITHLAVESNIEKENEKQCRRGTAVLKNDKCYYIYGEEGSDWLVFEILKSNINDIKLDKIIIDNNNFFTNYDSIKINQKEEFKIIAFATDEEMEKIKKSKKSYSKNEKQKTFSQNKKTKNQIEINDEKYIIKERIGDLICCVSIYDINKSTARCKYFNVKDIMSFNEEKGEEKQKKLVI